jgi:hypothetical protein
LSGIVKYPALPSSLFLPMEDSISDSLFALQMQLGILPVLKSAVAIESWAVEMDNLAIVLQKADFPAKKEMLAPGTTAHFIKGPPLLERIVSLQEFKLASKCGD